MGQETDIIYKILNHNNLFELKPIGIFNHVNFVSLPDKIGQQFIYLDPRNCEITLKSILNTNNLINANFTVTINVGFIYDECDSSEEPQPVLITLVYFISLEIKDDYLVFKYSLGDQINEIKIDERSVTNGKWRTITIEYKSRNVILSSDNDNFDTVDLCEILKNFNKTTPVRISMRSHEKLLVTIIS
ncbi:unnamed protein product [Brachionus calyciflorus]|uniref:Laminin G domain-containing protein n=1 Tax=Brachionus calyciflorus TaxID=104777 RepID=A0A813RMU3_9BILA|nr:unnamed protein product [Brachionus calyciflorus]